MVGIVTSLEFYGSFVRKATSDHSMNRPLSGLFSGPQTLHFPNHSASLNNGARSVWISIPFKIRTRTAVLALSTKIRNAMISLSASPWIVIKDWAGNY